MYIGLHVKYLFSWQILTKLEFSQPIFEKYSNIKFHGNLSSGSRVVPWGYVDRHEKTVPFRNFANAPKNVDARNFKPVSSRLFVDTLSDMADKIILAGKISFLLQYVESSTASLSLSLTGHFLN
jgi:hypothetical protein